MKTAKYKGREYELNYVGTTKHGERACLAFINGTTKKEFWVPADAISDIREVADPAPEKAPPRGHASLKVGEPCPTCGRTVIAGADDDDSIPF